MLSVFAAVQKKQHMGLNEKNFRPKREKNMSIFTVLG